MHSLENTRITQQVPLPSPRTLHKDVVISKAANQTVTKGRATIEAILERRDPRLFLVVGPCSVHDPKAAKEYAARLVALQEEVSDTLFLVMRVYFEKPRTTVGWKGLINDPDMDDSFDIAKGLHWARQLLLDVNEMGVPVGTEALDPLTPQYLGDLVAWSAIGARTTESQTHREMASGLSSPVGFKNGTDGSLKVAINAMLSASHGHTFLGVDRDGRAAITKTTGNQFGHLILRGGTTPNYDSVCIAEAIEQLKAAKLMPNIVVDCSHGNSYKNHERQSLVLLDVVRQVRDGTKDIVEAMLESNLVAGTQKIPTDMTQLVYGKSVTDACLDWATTEQLVREASAVLRA
jgi:3-deoxy-7-phosphoheptulonate synthase